MSARRAVVVLGCLAAFWACAQGATGGTAPVTHSTPIAVSPDGSRVYVVHPDADSVSAVDPSSRVIVFETLLAAAPPSMDAAGSYTPGVAPRSLALDATGDTLYVTGERSGRVYALDAHGGGVRIASATVCAEPAGIVVDRAGGHAFVACSNDDAVIELRTTDLSVVSRVATARKPWALAWAADGKTLVVTHLLGSGLTPTPANSTSLTLLATEPLGIAGTWTLPDVVAQTDPTTPNGEARAVYDAAVRPGTDELWVVHAMLAASTAEPALDFQSTVFPTVSILTPDGALAARLTVSTRPGDGGAFGDVVSGPQTIAFSSDGRYAFLVDANSEDVLVVDAARRTEAALIRPLPGHWPMGAALSSHGKLYIAERNTEDVAVVDVSLSGSGEAGLGPSGWRVAASVETPPVPSLARDPMPAHLRRGQRVFNSADSDQLPITQNHWVACASCHIEQRTDAVTWRFRVGPRDTPSNAGTLGTGFLLHTADRRRVVDYWRTIDQEQGGEFHLGRQQDPDLFALEDYVDHGIPLPVPPTTDASLVARGEGVFGRVGCALCHSGPLRTDSGTDNPTLDLSGPEVTTPTPGGVLVHDVNTCNHGVFPDVPHADMAGHARAACLFDTPSLRGLWDSAPYMHDGSATTLDDAVGVMLKAAASAGGEGDLPAADRVALVEYLKSL